MPNNTKITGNNFVALSYGASFKVIKGIHTFFVDDFLKSLKVTL
tara:strand:+ start:324 stop:455 length:132 start_codon:yes stop_codon:yes gene_type:complete